MRAVADLGEEGSEGGVGFEGLFEVERLGDAGEGGGGFNDVEVGDDGTELV